MHSENVLFKLLPRLTKNVTILNKLIIEFTFRVYIRLYMHRHAGISPSNDSGIENLMVKIIKKLLYNFTFPRLRSITTEDEVTNFYYGHGWFLVITVSMKGTSCPSMLSCTPRQRPLSACVFGP
jgi:hypothetical protein